MLANETTLRVLDPRGRSDIASWARLLGEEHVLVTDEALSPFRTSTTGAAFAPDAVLRPKTVEEVREIVRIANEHRTPLYPTSTACNWGYGFGARPGDRGVLVDLRRMDRVEVDAELGIAVIEPGVTQEALATYLRDKKLPYWLDVTGAGPKAGVLGNVLERGFGHTPYGDHFLHSSGYEVVLGDGRLVQTGFAKYPHARARYAYKHGVGPSLDGLFTQSNFGIVVRMAVYLMPIPECTAFFFASATRAEDLSALVDEVHAMRKEGVLTGTTHIANDLRVRSGLEGYPWEKYPDGCALPLAERKAWMQRTRTGAWTVFGALTGTRGMVRAASSDVRKRLSRFGVVRVVSARTVRAAERVLGVAGRLGIHPSWGQLLSRVGDALDLLQGTPSNAHLRGAGWRSRKPEPKPGCDPHENNWGLFWHAPMARHTGADATHMMGIITQTLTAHEFEPLVTLVSLSPRALCAIVSLCFDKSSAQESERAQRCSQTLWGRLRKEGYFPYRTSATEGSWLRSEGEESARALANIKRALDPNGILAPGKLALRDEPPILSKDHTWVQ